VNAVKHFFQKIKSGNLAFDDLSLFLISIALAFSIITTLFGFIRWIFLAWVLLILAYWRSYSKNRLQRFKENQRFIKHYYPISSGFQNFARRFMPKEHHLYFKCRSCTQLLRIPKKTDHIKVTCPKCNYSFIKKTINGYLRKRENVTQ